MPMTSMVAAPFIVAAERLAGVQLPNDTLFRAVQIPFVGLASALPLLSYAVAALTTRLRRHALAAASLTVFTGFYLGFWPNTDAFALYGLAGGGALLACGLARSRMLTHPHQSQRWIFLAGVLTGLAHLSRADGVLILLVVLGMTLHAGTTADAHATSHASARRIRLAAVFLALTGYSLIMFPWFVRNLLVVGTPLAPGGARVLWLIAYDDLFSYPADTLTAARYLAAGWGAILAGKWWALQVNLGTLLGPHTTIVAFPFALIGLWRFRRNELYAPAIVYYLALFGVMTLVFTFPGARGGLFHSGTALLPFFFPAALRGVDVCVEAVARRRPAWRADEAKVVFSLGLVILAALLSALIFQARVVGPDWRHPRSAQTDQVYAEIGDWLSRAHERAVVAVNNPPGFYYFSGYPGIVVPNGGVDELLHAVTDFGAHWVVLDANNPGLAQFYAEPESDPRLRLRATFQDSAGRLVYLFELDELP
jgi:hypothetical protein